VQIFDGSAQRRLSFAPEALHHLGILGEFFKEELESYINDRAACRRPSPVEEFEIERYVQAA
jgi:hypothetical protein